MPTRDPAYVFDATTTRNVVAASLLGDPVLLVGGPGDGKTSLVEQLAALTNTPLLKVEGHPDLRHHHLIGKDTLRAGSIAFEVAPFVEAFRRGAWVLLDEISVIPPGVLHAIHGVLNGDRRLLVPGAQVARGECFRLWATSNVLGAAAPRRHRFAGNQGANDSQLSRFRIVAVHGLDAHEVATVLMASAPSDSRPTLDRARRMATFYESARRAAFDETTALEYPITLRDLRALWRVWHTPLQTRAGRPHHLTLTEAFEATLRGVFETAEAASFTEHLLLEQFADEALGPRGGLV